jgi:hypothetical protein
MVLRGDGRALNGGDQAYLHIFLKSAAFVCCGRTVVREGDSLCAYMI